MVSDKHSIEDDRQFDVVQFDTRAFQLLPVIGPAAWAVYSFLLYHATRKPATGPSHVEIARGCGLSVDEVTLALDVLTEHGLIALQAADPDREITIYRILPASAFTERPSRPPHATQQTPRIETQPAGSRQADEPDVDAEDWKRRIEEKRLARQLFASFVTALGEEDHVLTDQERERIRQASEIVGQAGATPEQVRAIAERIRALQPRAAVDPVWIAEHWVELTRDLFTNEDHQHP